MESPQFERNVVSLEGEMCVIYRDTLLVETENDRVETELAIN